MRLGILGGTFDPVHYGHLLLAESCREQCRLDQVRFVPSAVAPHKQERTPAPPTARIEMLQLATAGHEPFTIDRFEVDRGGVNYTVETLRHVHAENPQAELFFLLGADMLLDLPSWREAHEVCRLATIVAVRRFGLAEADFACLASLASPERLQRFREHQVEMPPVGISSSEIRARVAAGRSIRYLTPRAVEMYIQTHGLYRA